MIRDEIARWIRAGLEGAQHSGALPPASVPEVEVERPRQASHGDYASSIALQLASQARMAPRQVAEVIRDHLPPRDFAGQVEVAGPGFINVTLSLGWLAQQIERLLAAPQEWGRQAHLASERILIEFVSANPTGPLHVGRAWGAVLGDTLARLFAYAGGRVSREYYFNNTGRQMQLLGESVQARYREQWGQPGPWPDDGYLGGYVEEIAREIVREVGPGWLDAGWPAFAQRAEAWMLSDIQRTLARLDVRFDTWFNEADLTRSGAVAQTLAGLAAAGVTYEQDGATWLRATTFGADKDRVLVKSSGESTYRLRDIAYFADKLTRGDDRSITILGADHQAEFPDVVNAVRALGLEAGRLEVLVHQFINLVRGGQAVRMSTRRATYVTLDDLLDLTTYTHPETGVTLAGKDPVRFMLLSRAPSRAMDFDLDLVRQQTTENPVYYVQYAHARLRSLEQKAEAEGGLASQAADLAHLRHPAELALLRKAVELPEVVARAIAELAPHFVATYAHELAANCHAFYHECPVIGLPAAQAGLAEARLKLARASRQVLGHTLDLMGMTARERM